MKDLTTLSLSEVVSIKEKNGEVILTMKPKQKPPRRGFLAENRFFLIIGRFKDGHEYHMHEEVLIWGRVKCPTRKDFCDHVEYYHKVEKDGYFDSLVCLHEFKTKADCDAYESDKRDGSMTEDERARIMGYDE